MSPRDSESPQPEAGGQQHEAANSNRTATASPKEMAKRLAEAGYEVFPLNGKVPFAKGWQGSTTTDVDAIHQWPDDWNYGIKTTGLVVVDVDPQHGGDRNTVRHLLDGLNAMAVSTGDHKGTRGDHYYLRGDTASWKDVFPGVEVRAGAGAYVVGPGSRHSSGVTYELLNELLPLQELSQAPEAFIKQRSTSSGDELPSVFGEGSRDDSLTSAAGHLRRIGLTKDEIQAALKQINLERCQPPLPDQDVERIAESVANYTPDTNIETLAAWETLALEMFEGTHEEAAGVAERAAQIELENQARDLVLARTQARKLERWGLPTGGDALDSSVSLPDDDLTAEDDQVAYLIDKLIPAAEKGVSAPLVQVYGDEYTGKSLWTMDLAYALSTGSDWWGRKLEQRNVLWLTSEDAQGAVSRRRALARKYAKASGIIILQEPSINLRNESDIDWIIDMGLKHDVGLLVVDHLQGFTAGVNENTNEINEPLINIKHAGAVLGAPALFVHHTGKGASATPRGFSGIAGMSETRVRVHGSQNARVAEVEKLKNGPKGEQFQFSIEGEATPTIVRGWGLGLGGDSEASKSDPLVTEHALTANQARKLREVDGGLTASEWRNTIGGRERGALKDRLIEAGVLVREEDGLYYLKPAEV